MEKDIAAGGVELAEARAHIAETRAALDELKESVKSKQKELQTIEKKIAEETKMLTAFKDELDALDGAIKDKRQDIADGELQTKELEHEIDRLRKDFKSAADNVTRLEKQFEWITDECQCVLLRACAFGHNAGSLILCTFDHRTFGKEGSLYNFNGVRMNEMKKKCQQLEEEQASMKKKVNPKVLSMIDR